MEEKQGRPRLQPKDIQPDVEGKTPELTFNIGLHLF
jgi:hypothetical protein